MSFLTATSEAIFDTIIEVQGGGSTGGSAKEEDGVVGRLTDFKQRIQGRSFNLIDIRGKMKEMIPYNVVCLQECERMNELLDEIDKSLEELKLGLEGALNMSDAMDALAKALTLNRVPANWEKKAYPSRKLLSSWFDDLILRCDQLKEWTAENIEIPKSIWVSGLFNPMSFLTAIMQTTSRAKGLPLDDMELQTTLTSYDDPKDLTHYAENGFYVHGFFLEGAAWEKGGQGNEGYLTQAKLKDLHPKLPVVNVVSVPKKEKKVIGQYQCPVYVTSLRGPTYVFTANLQMQDEEASQSEWILAGVALLMSED